MKKPVLKFYFMAVILSVLIASVVAGTETEKPNNISSAIQLIKDKEFDKAFHLLELAVKKQPDNSEAYYLMGYCHSIMLRPKEAVKAYKKAIRIRPDYPVALGNLGASYFRLKRYSKAIKAYKKAISYEPENPVYHSSLAEVYIALEHYEEAVEAYKKAISLEPGISEWHLNLGLAYLSIGDEASALKQFVFLKELDPYLADEFLKVIRGESETIKLFPHPKKPPVPVTTTK